jgi:hypothetical protein
MKNESEHKKLPVHGTNVIGTFFFKEKLFSKNNAVISSQKTFFFYLQVKHLNISQNLL